MRFLAGRARRVGLLATTAILGSMGIADIASAQQAATAPTDEIVVIGTHRNDRTLTTSASPVDVISAQELKDQPSANMLDTLKNLVPSFFVGQNTISDASSFTRSPSLRGLPGDEVLVMLNGKRYNRAALVQVYTGGDTGLGFGSQGSDISAIPSIAIKNLQVLRDGATAQYGSDAIAGVLDYGLKDKPSGVEVDVRTGEYQQNKDGKSTQLSANMGLPLGDRGFANVSAELDNDGGTSRGATRPLAVLFASANPSLANKLPNYPGPAQIWGSSPSHGYKFVLNSGVDVTPQSQLYFFANLAHTIGNESFNYRAPNKGTFVDTAGVSHTLNPNGALSAVFYQTPCPAATPTCPAGGFVKDTNTFSFLSIYPAGFTPRFVGQADEAYATGGYKGSFSSGLTYDFSASFSKNTLTLSMYNSLSPTYGAASQTSFKFGKLSQKESVFDADFSYPLQFASFASPVTLSWGGEWRKETYGQTAGDPQSYGGGTYATPHELYTLVAPGMYADTGATTAALGPGASGYGGTSPAAAGSWSLTNYSLFADAEADLTNKLSVGLAGRYEHYNTFGGDTVGKLNAIYKLTDTLSVRGTIGSGFHAPSPGQSNDEILTTNFVGGNQVQTGNYPVTSPISKYYGATTLKPEKSTNYGFGIVAKLLTSTTLTVDAYQIDVTDRIGISQTFNVSAADLLAQPALAAVGQGGAVTYFTNGFDTSTQGVDVVATHHTTLLGGKLNLTLAYNYNKSKVTRISSTTVGGALTPVISAAQAIDVGHLAPNHRLNFAGAWTYGPWTVNARENYYGSWQDAVDYPGQVFGAKATTDLDVSYTLGGHYTVTAGGANIFNQFPDKIAASATNPIYPITGSLADGQVYPRNGGPFGINGAFWYVRLRASF